MNVVTRVSKLCNLLGQELYTVHRVAKDNTLVDLQFREQCVQTMNLLPFLDIGIELRYSPQREFIHEIDGVRLLHKFTTKRFDSDREGGTKKANLVVWIRESNNLFKNGLKFWREKFVSFVHDNGSALGKISHLL